MRIHVESLEVLMDAERGVETIDSVKYEVKVKSDAPTEKLQRCLENTEKACPVGVLFNKAGVKIDGKLTKI
jgi:putative redox protein